MSMTGEELLALARQQRERRLSPVVATAQVLPSAPRINIGTFDPKLVSVGKKDEGGGGLIDIIPSFFSGAGKAVTMVPTFLGKAGQTIAGLGEGAFDTAVDLIPGVDYTSRFERDYQKAKDLGLKGFDRWVYATQRQYPLVGDISRGVQTTGSRFVDVLPGIDTGEPGVDYAAAYRRGDLGELLFQDLGNVVLVGRSLGAGNLIEGAGGAISEAGMPRFGAGVARTGRFVEQPFGTMARGAARVGQFGAETFDLAGAARLSRIAQAGLGESGVGPLRQGINEVIDIRRTQATSEMLKLQTEVNDLIQQRTAENADQINAKIADKIDQFKKALVRSGLPKLAKKDIVAAQKYEEAFRNVMKTEAARIKTQGPSAVFPDAAPGPMPDFASPVAVLQMTGQMPLVMQNLDAGLTVAEITQALTPSGIGPDLELIGYRLTEEQVQKAIDYERGTLSKFDQQSVDAARQLLTTVRDEFTKGQRSGRYRLGGPMPETYLGTKPIVEFLLSEADNGRLRQPEQAAMFGFLDGATAQLLERFSEEQKQGLDFPVDKPEGAFRALATVPADHPLAGIAQRMLEILYPQLLKDFPNIFRKPSIYPAPMRPAIHTEARLLAAARAKDINSIVVGLNQIADRYGNAIGKGLVESLRNDLAEVIGTPRQYLPGSYTRIVGKMRNLLLRVREDIVKLQEKQAALTAENRLLLTQLIEAEQALGAVEQTVRTLVDNLNQIADETLAGVTEAKTNLGLSQEQVRIAEEAIRVYEREQAQAQLALTPDERQVLVDEIDTAARWLDQFDDPVALDNLIAEFDYRRREVEAGRQDPATVQPKLLNNRSKEVKAYKEQRIAELENLLGTLQADLDLLGDRTISYRLYHFGSSTMRSPLKDLLTQALHERFASDVVAEALSQFEATRIGKYDPATEMFPLDLSTGYGGEDFIATGMAEDALPDAVMATTDAQIGELARRLGEKAKATLELRRMKKLRLYEIADEMNANRATEETFGLDLPTTARIIAYATNPTLLSADLMLRDRYVIEMETGVPYEGAPQRLIPIPKELIDQLAQAQKDVTKQEKTVARLRREGTEEQRRLTRTRLKGVGKIVEQPDGTLEGQLLKGPQTKAESAIEQMRNKDLYQQNKLAELRAKNAEKDAIEAEVQGVAQSATAVGEYMARPFAPMLIQNEPRFGYLPGGLPRTARGATRVMTELQTEGAAPQVASPVEQMRTTDIMPLRLDDMITRFDEIFNVIGRNRVIEDIITDPNFARRMGSFLDQEQMAALEAQARAEVEAQGLIRTPGQVDAEVRKLVGKRLVEIAKRNGYEPVTPVKVDPETGAHEAVGDLLSTVADESVDVNTILMRIGMRERLTQEFVLKGSSDLPPAVQRVMNTVGSVTTGWKSIVLPFSARWQTGDAVSNVLNAWAKGDISPAELVAKMREVDQLLSSSGKRLEVLGEGLQNDLLSLLIGAGVQARGIRDFELAQLRGLNPEAAIKSYEVTGPYGTNVPGLRLFPKFREKSFRFNEYQNFVARVATSIIKLERVLSERGRTIDEATSYTYLSDPVIRDATNEAVQATNDALGAFTELNPFEKRVVRNIYPFWSWIRYINKAALDMAIDSPDRILFAASLGSIVSEPEQAGLFPFLRGMTPVQGYFFDLSFLNPYQDAFILSDNPVRALFEQVQNVNPALTAPVRGLSAISYYGGGPQLQLPGGYVQRPGYLEGRSGASTRSFGDLVGELGYLGLSSFGGPARNILNFFPTGARIPGTDVALGNVQRFPQGSARTEGRYAAERLPRAVSLLSTGLSILGVPRPIITEEAANQQARLQAIADIRAQERRQRERLLSRIVT